MAASPSVHIAEADGLCAVAFGAALTLFDLNLRISLVIDLPYDARALAVDPAGATIAVSGGGKSVDLFVISRSVGAAAVTLRRSTRTDAPGKRIINMAFDGPERLLLGDKTGEVFRCVVAPSSDTSLTLRTESLAFSHVGLVTALATSIAANAIVSADRSGNLRVSSRQLPDDIKGFMWLPLNVIRTFNAMDNVVVAVGWATPVVLLTGTLDGIVAAWDLSRSDVDQAGAYIDGSSRSFVGCVVGFVQAVDSMAVYAAIDGEAFLKPIHPPFAVEPCLPAAAIAAHGNVVLLRDGTLCVVAASGVQPIAGFSLRDADKLTSIDVKELWHVREQREAKEQNSEDDGDGDEHHSVKDEPQDSGGKKHQRGPRPEASP